MTDIPHLYHVVVVGDLDDSDYEEVNSGGSIFGPVSKAEAQAFCEGVSYVNDSALSVEIRCFLCGSVTKEAAHDAG
jgi:hypothetical protein